MDSPGSSVREHLKELGWGDELSKMGLHDPKVEQHSMIVKICKKNITEQG